MFKLMNRISGGISPMLQYLETHIVSTGLADMTAHADTITTVSHMTTLNLYQASSSVLKHLLGTIIYCNN